VVKRALARHCIECNAMCCRKGYLPLERRLSQFCGQEKESGGRLLLSLDGGCPALFSGRCMAYSRRPKACREFPIKVEEDTVIASSSCPAVKSVVHMLHGKKVMIV